MSATNHTANYELSQYIGSDEPKYLTDYNGDMSKIDTAIKGVDTKAETANTGVATNASAISALDTAVGSLQTQVATVASVANGNTGSINTINSLIGNGEPTTTDKTIIGAINEINAEIGGGVGGLETRVSALETGVSGLNTSVGAIETEIGNTALPTTAQTLTGAIAEIATSGGGAYDFDLTKHTGDFTITSTFTVSQSNSSCKYALNNDKSIGKIYGGIYITGSITPNNNWLTVATLTSSDMPTITDAYNIEVGFSIVTYSGTTAGVLTRLHFNTDGTVDVQIFDSGATTYGNASISLPPCIYFLKDFGD